MLCSTIFVVIVLLQQVEMLYHGDIKCMHVTPSCQGGYKILEKNKLCSCPVLKSKPPHKRESDDWNLLCRTDKSATFSRSNQGIIENNEYIVNLKTETSSIRPLTLLNDEYLEIKKLLPNTSYFAQFMEVKNGELFGGVETHRFSTLSDTDDTCLDPPEKVIYKEWIPRGKTLGARISWTPGKDSGCHFDFIWISAEGMGKKEIRNVNELYETIIYNLTYNTNYTLSVAAILDGTSVESSPVSYSFKTPRCLDFPVNTMEVCVPEKLEGLKVNETQVENSENSSALYDVLVTWKKPKSIPLKYHVELTMTENSNTSILHTEVPGNLSEILFSKVALGNAYKVRLWAVSLAGAGPPAYLIREAEPDSEPISSQYDIILPSVSLCLIIGSAVLLGIFCRTYRSHIKRRKKFDEDAKESVIPPIEKYQPLDVDFEVDRDSLIMQDILGEGAFGVVRKGILKLKGKEEDVAVKMLKEKPSEEEKEQLLQEARMLLTIGAHKNVVSLVACVTACPTEEMLVIVEYCAFGDLQHYLRNVCRRTSDPTTEYGNVFGTENGMCVSNKLYEFMGQREENEKMVLSLRDKLKFGREVAEGMEFLANNRIIHRDLAARNVLVTGDRSLKISDFGLSRDIYDRNVYVKTSTGKVPIKWMALESLMHQIYTTQSDVWSFGVLMWEIMTLGAMPFSDYSPLYLMQFLTSGGRLAKPKETPAELYDLMTACWSVQPADRPRFTDLRLQIDLILEKTQ